VDAPGFAVWEQMNRENPQAFVRAFRQRAAEHPEQAAAIRAALMQAKQGTHGRP
jgi:hypothetical protein